MMAEQTQERRNKLMFKPYPYLYPRERETAYKKGFNYFD